MSRSASNLAAVDADDDQLVLVLLFELRQVGQHVVAVDAAKRPEIEQHDLAAQLGKRDRTGIDPADASLEAGCAALAVETSAPRGDRRPTDRDREPDRAAPESQRMTEDDANDDDGQQQRSQP